MIYNVMFYFIALLIVFVQNIPSSYGAETKIYALSVNTKADEDDPYYCLGARTSIPGRLYFTRKSETGKWDIFWSKFDSTKRTLGKEEMVGAQIESTGDDQTPFVSPEGVFPQWILFLPPRINREAQKTFMYLSAMVRWFPGKKEDLVLQGL